MDWAWKCWPDVGEEGAQQALCQCVADASAFLSTAHTWGRGTEPMHVRFHWTCIRQTKLQQRKGLQYLLVSVR